MVLRSIWLLHQAWEPWWKQYLVVAWTCLLLKQYLITECKVQLSVSLKEIRQLPLSVWSLFSFKFSLNLLFNAVFHLHLPLSPSSRLKLPRSFSQALVICVALQLYSPWFLSLPQSALPSRAKYLAFSFVAFMYQCTRSIKHSGTGNSL